MKQGWEIKKLGEIGTIITGSTPSTKDNDNYSSMDYCFVKPSDISNESISLIQETEAYISEKAFLKSRKLPKGSVLTTCIGIIGKVGILNVDATCNQQINGIIPDENCIISEFLAYSLISRKRYLQGIANAPVVPIINKKEFSDVSIPVPPLPEQEKIVSELDCLSGIIEKKRQQLKELDALAQSIFYEMFGDPVDNERGWEMKKLGEVCVLKSGDSSANNTSMGTLPYVKVGDMNMEENNPYITTSSTFVNREENIKGIFPVGTTIFPKRGGAIFTNKKRLTTVEICCDLNTMGVIPMSEVLPIYIYYYFVLLDFSELCNGATIPQINNKDIAPLDICIPPISVQQSFASKIEGIEQQKALIKQSIAEVETLFNARMKYYFD